MSDWSSQFVRKLMVWGWLALFVGVGLLIYAFHQGWRTAYILEHGLRVDAQMVGHDMRRPWYGTRKARYRYYVTLEYGPPNGGPKHRHEFEVKRDQSAGIVGHGHRSVTFLEDDPQEVVLTGVDPWDPTLFVFGGLLIFFFICAALYERQEYRGERGLTETDSADYRV